jgi:translocator assembly and maintenance protein 41
MQKLSFNQTELLDTYTPDFAMAYGSGVFHQEGYTKDDKPMIDFILGTSSTQNWHKENLKNNKKDYSLIAKSFGPKFINYLQKTGAKIYYNPYVSFNSSTIKYGVISTNDIIKDLTEWENLYVAGRLQKPVKILKNTPEIQKAIEINLVHAMNTALLLLPENFSQEELFMIITGLSYTGDSRMKY